MTELAFLGRRCCGSGKLTFIRSLAEAFVLRYTLDQCDRCQAKYELYLRRKQNYFFVRVENPTTMLQRPPMQTNYVNHSNMYQYPPPDTNYPPARAQTSVRLLMMFVCTRPVA